MKIRVILFDADGVLFKSNTAVSQELNRKFGISEEELLPMWKGEYRKLSSGVYSTKEFLALVTKKYNLSLNNLSSLDFTGPYTKTLETIYGIEDLVNEISNLSITLAILSDTAEMFHLSRRNMDILKHFDRQFLSFESGYMKPDKRAFKKVLDYYKLRPSEIFFIDDNPDYVDSAKKLGFHGTVFENTAQLRRELTANQII